MSGVKSIFFKMGLEGSGIVNMEGTGQDQKGLMKEAYGFTFGGGLNVFNSNTTTAKHFFSKSQNGEVKGKIIISSNCLRHALNEEEMPFQSKTNRRTNEAVALVAGSFTGMLQGYLETSAKIEKDPDGDSESKEETKKGKKKKEVNPDEVRLNDTLKRASPVTITAAIQNNDALPNILSHTTKGVRDSNSFFFKEEIGDITYEATGCFDLLKLSFLCMDDRYGDMAIHPDTRQTFVDAFYKNTGFKIDLDTQFGEFVRTTQIETLTQIGILFTPEQVEAMVKFYLKKMRTLLITKASGKVWTSSLSYNLISNPTKKDQLFGSKEFTEINTLEDIDNLHIDMYNFYKKV